MKVEIPYPGENKIVDIPDRNIMMIGNPRDMNKASDVRKLVSERIRSPIGIDGLSSKLRQGKKITVLVDDVTRRTPVPEVLPVLIDELLAHGAQESDIQIWIARGMHRDMTLAEQKEKVGEDIFRRFKTRVHNYEERDNLAYKGQTSRGTPIWINRSVVESDIVIGIGGILLHWFAGYGGGAKIILPGICGRETVLRNHNILDASCSSGRLEGNPLREDIEEVASKAGLYMKIDCVMNSRNELVDLYAGDFVQAHRRAVRKYNDIYSIALPGKAEIVLTSTMPKYHTLSQGIFMPMCSMYDVTRDNATIIIDCPAIEGYSFSETGFAADMKARLSFAQLKQRVQKGTIFEAISLYHTARIRDKRNIIVVSKNLTEDDMTRTGFKHAATLEKAVQMALERHGENSKIAVIPYGFTSVPVVM